MWGPMEGWGWGMGIAHGLLWWVFLVLGIIVLVRFIARGPGAGAAAPPAETALDILKKRYARGEIGKQEFEEKRRDIAS